jgi:hypothetical protein
LDAELWGEEGEEGEGGLKLGLGFGCWLARHGLRICRWIWLELNSELDRGETTWRGLSAAICIACEGWAVLASMEMYDPEDDSGHLCDWRR